MLNVAAGALVFALVYWLLARVLASHLNTTPWSALLPTFAVHAFYLGCLLVGLHPFFGLFAAIFVVVGLIRWLVSVRDVGFVAAFAIVGAAASGDVITVVLLSGVLDP